MNPVKPQLSRWAISVIVVLGGITGYWAFTYSGPYRYLAELEIKWLGSYSPEGTVALVAFGWVLVAAAIKLVFLGPDKDMARRFRVLTGREAAARADDIALHMPERWAFMRFARFAILAIFLGGGGWFYYNGTHAGSLRQLDAADFQNGKVQTRMVYAEVRGHLSKQYLRDNNDYLYVPMTSQDAAGAPVQLIVGVNEREIRKYVRLGTDGTSTVRGIADKGLQADVKYAFEKNGMKVADPVWVVHAGRDPAWDKQGGLLMITVGIVFACIVAAIEGYLKRKKANEQPLQADVQLE
jgi:hypothetical protein